MTTRLRCFAGENGLSPGRILAFSWITAKYQKAGPVAFDSQSPALRFSIVDDPEV